MKRRFNNNYKSILNGVERAKKLKDLEIAKSLEINSEDKDIVPGRLEKIIISDK